MARPTLYRDYKVSAAIVPQMVYNNSASTEKSRALYLVGYIVICREELNSQYKLHLRTYAYKEGNNTVARGDQPIATRE